MSDGAIARFAKGFGTVPRAIGLISRTPKLRALAIWPTIVSALLLGGGLYVLIRYGRAASDAILPDSVERLVQGVRWLVDIVVRVLLGVAWLVAMLFGSQILAEPFLDPLSEHTEAALGAAVEPRRGLLAVAGGLLRVVADIAVDLGLYLLAIAVVFVLHLLPVVGVFLGPVGGWYVNALFAGTSQVASPLSRRGHFGFGRWRAARADRARLLGLGTAVFLLLMIPLAQVLTLPIAVVAGTIAVVESEQAGRIGRSA